MIFSTQALALFLNALLVAGNGNNHLAVGGDVSRQMTELNGLQFIYPQEQLNIHNIESIPVVAGRRQLQAATGTEERSLHITCSPYNEAAENERILKVHLGNNNVYPSYVSESSDAVCFATFMKPSEASAVQDLPSIRSVVKVPTELKINHLVLSSLGLFHGDSSISAKKPKLQEFLSAKLIMFGGVGVLKNIPSAEDFISADQLKSLLSSDVDAVSYLNSLVSDIAMHRPKSEIWSNALARLQNSPSSCAFSSLVVESSSSGPIAVGGLKEFVEGSGDLSVPCIVSLLAILVQQKGVSEIRYRLPKVKFNENGKSIIQAETFGSSSPYTDAGIDGTGQIVGIGDTGLDELSCFFRNSDSSKVARSPYYSPTFDLTKRKVIQYINYCDDSDTFGGHGTHVSGTVAGNLIGTDTTFQSDNGHASGAKIAFFDMEYSAYPEYGIRYPEPFDDNVLQPAYNAGARLHSNSWGSGYNFYDDSVFAVDDFSYINTDFLALFAASNDGSDGYYSIGSPAVSKNAITVGATQSSSPADINNVAYFSSIGPTFDNRIKPDVVAPGYSTISACASGTTASQTCQITSMAGTSMATPATAGAAAQIRGYFANGDSYHCRYHTSTTDNADCSALTNPKGATVKALLVQSGKPITKYNGGDDTVEPTSTLSATPDMYQGFGRVSLMNILPYAGIQDNLFIVVTESSIAAGYRITYTVSVSSTTLPLKATLVWMDPTNSVITSKMLLNDLDLQVKYVPTSQVYYGNGIQRDEYNNVEQVYISSPLTGTYEISVSAASYLTTTSQAFSLIIGSAGLTYTSKSTSTSFTTCTSTQELVYMTAMDHDGDGWGTGNSYTILKDGVTITTGTMSGAVGEDSIKHMSMCLDNGDYTVQLIQTGSDSDEMGFEIDNQVYLSRYQTTGSFTVPAPSCAAPTFDMLLYGSLYGVPYGWNGDTNYQLRRTNGGSLVYGGTLVTGMLRDHSYCLPDGTWELTMNDVPKNDDFFDDDYMGGYFGAEEYYIEGSISIFPFAIDSRYVLTFTLEGGTLTSLDTKKVSGGDDEDDDDLTAGGAAAIALGLFALVAGIICCGLCYWNSNKKQSNGGLASQEAVEISMK